MPKLYLLILTNQFIIAKKQDNIIIAKNRAREEAENPGGLHNSSLPLNLFFKGGFIMEKYYKLEKINRQKFETEGNPMYFQTLAEAKKKAAEISNEEYGYSITEIREIVRDFEV